MINQPFCPCAFEKSSWTFLKRLVALSFIVMIVVGLLMSTKSLFHVPNASETELSQKEVVSYAWFLFASSILTAFFGLLGLMMLRLKAFFRRTQNESSKP